MKKTKYVIREKRKFILLAAVTVIFMAVYLAWRITCTLPGVDEFGWFGLILGIALWIAELSSAIEAFVHCMDLSTKMEPEMPKIPEEWYPDVDVFIATHNEEEDILFKTGSACTYMRYPDPKKVHIYFCDDGNRESVKALADRLGIGYLGLADNKLAKAGNLNNALSKTNSPLVATFDADMIPTSDFLMETVPYFFLPKMRKNADGEWCPCAEGEESEDKIGFIQTPQSFYNPDLFQYNLFSENMVPNEQDYFFKQVNVGKNKANAPIYAGSNTVILREALEEVGGICTGTITEDFETGLLIEAAGYRCFAVNKVLAKGLAPTTISGLIKQRERWARGCVHSLRRHHILLNPKFSLSHKMAYMACRSYWNSFMRRFVYILSPILFVLLGIPAVVCELKELVLIWLPTYVLYGFSLKVMSGKIRNPRISNLVDTILFPYLMVAVLAESLHIHKEEFVVTDKSKRQSEDKDKLLALPHAVLLIFSVVALVLCVKDMIMYQAVGSIVLLYWLCVNSSSLLMAVFFMLGRKNYRTSERFVGRIPITITIGELPYNVVTEDYSEGGMSVNFPNVVYIDPEEEVQIDIVNRRYITTMKAKVASVNSSKNGGYKYSFQIKEIDEENRREYLQIIFDRESSLPTVINKKSSVYGDISANISKRLRKNEESRRKLVRMAVNQEYPLVTGESVFIRNFNFEYILLEERDSNPQECQVDLDRGVIMKCHGEKGGLYQIDNLEELQNNTEFKKIVDEWERKDS